MCAATAAPRVIFVPGKHDDAVSALALRSASSLRSIG
jgi:hypothetical protein